MAREAAEKVQETVRGTSVVLHMMSEDDVQTVLQHPSTMVGSDGIPTLDGKPHPRLYNSFARVLGHYARDQKLMSLAEAVYRMTGMSAEKFGLQGRGVIGEGYFSDLVLFNANQIIDRGTFEDPNQYPDGIEMVVVNGVVTVDKDQVTDISRGRVLRRVDG